MTETRPPDRCRLVLIAPPGDADDARLHGALGGGDVASLLLPRYDLDEDAFQRRAERLVPLFQEAGVAVILAADTRVAARVGADGVHFEGPKHELAALVDKHRGRMMIGCGGAKNRDVALEFGETQPDYIFFGRFGYDVRPEPHQRNLKLGAWWAEMIEMPAIVLGGSAIASVETVAATGVDFVALSAAVLGAEADPAEAVRQANAMLDDAAPRLGAAR